jgi:hypothetical protein
MSDTGERTRAYFAGIQSDLVHLGPFMVTAEQNDPMATHTWEEHRVAASSLR